MKKKAVSEITLILLLFGMLTLSFKINPVESTPRTIIVPTHYPTITDALNFAMDGDTIYVLNGTYREYISIYKSVKLIGENKNATIIEGSVALVANNIELKHFNVTRIFEPMTGGYAVLLHRSSNILIEDNIIQCNNGAGIYFQTDPGPPPQNITILRNDILWYSVPWDVWANGIQSSLVGGDYSRTTGNLKLIGNRIEGWPSSAIAAYLSGKNEFINNTILNNQIGMGFGFSESGNLFRGNRINGTAYPFRLWSQTVKGFLQDIDTSNLINGRPIYYLVNQNDVVIDHETYPKPGFLGLIDSRDITIQNLDISADLLMAYVVNSTMKNMKASQEIEIFESKNVTIWGSAFNGTKSWNYIAIRQSSDIFIEKNDINKYGLSLSKSTSFIITENDIQNGYGVSASYTSTTFLFRNHIVNNTVGIQLSDSTNFTISENFVSENGMGMRLYSSNDNYIYLNNFIQNEQQLELLNSFMNSYDNGAEGNYWSDYNGTDTNRDGIGDTKIPHLKVDWFPLMGMTSFFDVTYRGNMHEISTISNSTVIDAWLDETLKSLNFNMTGAYNTIGFCRTKLPKGIGSELLDNNYTILINGNKPFYFENWTNNEYAYMYFEYEHPQDAASPITTHDYDDKWRTVDFIITLTAIDYESGVAETYYQINDGPTNTVSADGQPRITTESANNTLEYWSIDNAGNEESHHILTGIKLDKTAPAGSIAINDDATHTNSSSVSLILSADDTTSRVAQMRFSHDNVTWTPWEAYATSKAWTLTTGDGTKTVFVQYMDNAGLISPSYQDTIILDTISPLANAGQDQTVNVGTTVTFDAGGSTDNVGIVSYEWNFGDGTTGTGKTTTHTYTNPGTYTVILTVKDVAGNTATDSITVTVHSADAPPPPPAEAFPMWIIGAAAALTGIAVAITFLLKRRK